MKKYRNISTCFLCALFFFLVYGAKIGNQSEFSEQRHLCDFEKRSGCAGLIAEERWQLTEEGEDSFLLANFKQGESSVLTYATLVKPPLSNHVCLILKHFRNATRPTTVVDVSRKYISKKDELENLPKIYIGIEPASTIPIMVEEVSGTSNEWVTDYFHLSVNMSFRFFVKVHNAGVKDAKVAFKYLDIRDGDCTGKRTSTPSKYIQEMGQVEDISFTSDISFEEYVPETNNYEVRENNLGNLPRNVKDGKEADEQKRKVIRSAEIKYKKDSLKVKRDSSPFGNIVNGHVTFGPGLKKYHLRPKKEVKKNDSQSNNITNSVQSKKTIDISKDQEAFSKSESDYTTEEKNKTFEHQNVSFEMDDKITENIDIATSSSGSDELSESINGTTSSESVEVINEANGTSESPANNITEKTKRTDSDSKSLESTTELAKAVEINKMENITIPDFNFSGDEKGTNTDTLTTITTLDEKDNYNKNKISKGKKNSVRRASSETTLKRKKDFNRERFSNEKSAGESFGEIESSGIEKTVNNESLYTSQNTDIFDIEITASNEDSAEYENIKDLETKEIKNFQRRNKIFKKENSSDVSNEEVEKTINEDNFKEDNYYKGKPSLNEEERKKNIDEVNISMEDKTETTHHKENVINDKSEEENVSYISNQNKLLISLHNIHRCSFDNEGLSGQTKIRTENKNNLKQLVKVIEIDDFPQEESSEENREENCPEEGESENETASMDELHPGYYKGSSTSESDKAKTVGFNKFLYSDVRGGAGDSFRLNNVILNPRHRLQDNEDELIYHSSDYDTYGIGEQTAVVDEEPRNFGLPKISGNEFISNLNTQNYGSIPEINFHLLPDRQNIFDNQNKNRHAINSPQTEIEKLAPRNILKSDENTFHQSNLDFSYEDLFTDSLDQPKYPKMQNYYENSRQIEEPMYKERVFPTSPLGIMHPHREDGTVQRLSAQYDTGNVYRPLKKRAIANDVVKSYRPQSSGNYNQRKKRDNCGGEKNIKTNMNKNIIKPIQVKGGKNIEHKIPKFQILPPKFGNIMFKARKGKKPEDNQMNEDDGVHAIEDKAMLGEEEREEKELVSQNHDIGHNYLEEFLEYSLESGQSMGNQIIKSQVLPPKFGKKKFKSMNEKMIEDEKVNSASANEDWFGREEQKAEDLVTQNQKGDQEEDLEETLKNSVVPSVLKIFRDFHEYIKNRSSNKKTSWR